MSDLSGLVPRSVKFSCPGIQIMCETARLSNSCRMKLTSTHIDLPTFRLFEREVNRSLKSSAIWSGMLTTNIMEAVNSSVFPSSMASTTAIILSAPIERTGRRGR